jgi:Ca2+-binding RTX toxin-like protein
VIYNFSALADGQSISFNPTADILNFDQNIIAAADLRVVQEGASTRVSVLSGTYAGKDILLSGATPFQLATTNVRFADGSALLIGDNSTATGDDAANTLSGGDGRDQLSGFGGNDSLVGGAGDDVLNGGAGADTLNGGPGDDSYIVTAGDVLSDSGGIDTVHTDVSWTLGAEFENLTMTGTASISVQGNNLNNLIVGNDGNNFINPRAGDDTIYGMGGNDSIDMSTGGTDSPGNKYINGGAGIDTVDFDGYAKSALIANLGAGWVVGGGVAGAGSSTIYDVERFIGGSFDDGIVGGAGADYLDGRGGNDTINGDAGNDTLLGGAGNDNIVGGTGNDSVSGGAGSDAFLFDVAPGGANADRITDFSSGVDDLRFDGTAYANGLGPSGGFVAGDERFWAAAGAASGHDGTDRLIYDTSTGNLWFDADGSGSGGAHLVATLQPGAALAATDITVDNGSGTIQGTSGNDSLEGADGPETLDGGAGNDTLAGAGGDDVLLGGDGDDSLDGGSGADSIVGGNGNDTLVGSRLDPDIDTMDGGAGNDSYIIGRDFSTSWSMQPVLRDSGGIDTIVANSGHWTLGAGFENLTLGFDFATDGNAFGQGNELDNVITGFHGWWVSNTLDGGDGNDTLTGGDARDTFLFAAGTGNIGQDSVNGGRSDDLLDFSGARSGVAVDFRSGAAAGGGNGGSGALSFESIEAVYGSRFGDRLIANDGVMHENVRSGEQWFAGPSMQGRGGNDTLMGGAAADTLYGDQEAGESGLSGDDSLVGGGGNDTLSGGAGADRLDGGIGNDSLSGGTGGDSYAFTVAPGTANADTIADFESGQDLIRLDAAVHATLGASGRFGAGDGRFYAGAGATSGHDADDRVIYNTTTGQLSYDADGAGAVASQLIATLQAAPALAATDIAVDNGTPGSAINGTPGNDSLTGTTGGDTIDGGAGNDTINGSAGDDSILGGTGNDSLVGAEGVDTLRGGEGNDTLNGDDSRFGDTDAVAETLDGGLGDDLLIVDHAADTVTDAGGIDTVRAVNIDWTLGAGFENLQLWNAEVETRRNGIGNELANVLDASAGGWGVFLDGRAGGDTILGSARHDTLLGGDGNDSIDGLDGIDNLDGGAGNDTLYGGFGSGDDALTGGSGADRFVLYPSLPDSITDFAGGADKLRLDGTFFADVGPNGNYGASDGRFYAAAGATSGHDADDRLIFDTSTRGVWYDADGSGSGAAMHVATLQPGATLAAGDIEVVNGSAPGNSIGGTEGNDTLTGTDSADRIEGRGGNDLIDARAGDDTLDGGAGIDSMNGGAGNDTYIVTAGDVLSDSGGVDTVFSDASWNLGPEFENLTFTGTAAANAQGNNLANVITGNDANNFINARAGNDTLYGMGGNDSFDMSTGGTSTYGNKYVDGGAGIDTVDFDGYARTGVTANLATGGVTGGGDAGAGSATLVSIERFIGGAFNDRITGSNAANYLDGRGGNDTIDGGLGNDTLIGGAGSDSFVFSTAPSAGNADLVSGFVSGADKLSLDDAAFSAIGAPGEFSAGDARFFSGAGATAGQDASDRLIYNTSTGALYYDADGSGAGASQLVATLQANPAVTATDISVI